MRHHTMLMLALFLPVSAGAEIEMLVEQLAPHRAAGEATTVFRYDDGSAENGFRAATFPNSIELAMEFTAGAPGTIDQIEVCIQRATSADRASGTFGIGIYTATAAGPGTPLHLFDATLNNQPVSGLAGSFRTFDLPPPARPIPARFFIVVELDRIQSDFWLCADHHGIAGPRPIFGSVNNGPWTPLRSAAPQTQALIIRARVETASGPPPPPPPPPPGDCVPDGDTLCLIDGRFRVEVDFATSQGGGSSGAAGVVPGIAYTDSGLFYFFQPNNWEMLIKVIDACTLNNRFWVFYAATTNVGFTVTVTDTQTGEVWSRTNPDLTAAAPVQDTSALGGCGPSVQ